MADPTDVQKVRARSELEKLNRPFVAEPSPLSAGTAASEARKANHGSDASLAMQVVRETKDILRELRTIEASQSKKLDDIIAENKRLSSEVSLTQKRYQDLLKEASDLRSLNLNLQNTKDQLNGDYQKLVERHKVVEDQLKDLIAIVIKSLGKDQLAETV